MLLALLDWRAGAKNGLSSQMKWNEAEASVGRVLAVEVLRLLAAEGVHSQQVKEILDASEVGTALMDFFSATGLYRLIVGRLRDFEVDSTGLFHLLDVRRHSR